MRNLLNRFTSKAAITASVAAMCVGLSGAADALSFNDISAVYFFGDSLSDSGYFDSIPSPVPLPAGKNPTFTTAGGYPWSQYVARDILGIALTDSTTNNTTNAIIPTPPGSPPSLPTSGAKTGINYAAGGSTTDGYSPSIGNSPSLHLQVLNYLNSAPLRLDPKAVYFIWSGANDFLRAIGTPVSSPLEQQILFFQTAQTAATNIASEVAALSARGAKRIVVLSLPNLGLTPLVQLGNPSEAGTLKGISYTFNGMLNVALGSVIRQFGIKVLLVNTYEELNAAYVATNAGVPFKADGKSFQFINNPLLPIPLSAWSCTTNQPSLPTPPNALFCDPADSTPAQNPKNFFLFADWLHPTDLGHQATAALVEEKIKGWQ